MKNENRYRKMALRLYDELAENEEKWDIEEYEAMLREELAANSADEDLLDQFAHDLALNADRTRSGSQAETLFDEEGLDHVERLGNGQRLKRRYMRRTDVFNMLGLAAENAARVSAAFARKQREANELLPYFTDESVTYEHAFAAWRRENPDAA